MTTPRCDRTWEAEAHREGRLGPRDAESFERHCRTCASCAEGLARDDGLRALGRALPAVEPGQLALKRLRARVLRDVVAGVPSRSTLSGRRVAFASAMGIALATLAGFVAVRASSRTPVSAPMSPTAAESSRPLAGSVAPAAGAVWTQTREGGTEHVALEAGTLRVHVRAQGPGERFVVRLPDGELEVRGTTFEVTVLDGGTRHVGVDDGTVVLRLRGEPDRSLGPGASWGAPQSSLASPHEAPAVSAASAPAAAPPRRSSAEGQDVKDEAPTYVAAMRSFREGRYDSAAVAFHAYALARPRASEAEDASFLEALSLARAGRAEAAGLAAERHLESFPRSFRREEASILVARAASRRGRCDQALVVLAPWMSAAPDPEVQSVLHACGDGGGSAVSR